MTEFPPVLLVGAGKMGAALFGGWFRAGLAPSAIIDPHPALALTRSQDVWAPVPGGLPADFVPAIVVLAVKPQVAPSVLPALDSYLPAGCVVLSIMAGLRLDTLARALGGRPIVRAMPNTPAAIGQGMTVACAGPGVSESTVTLCGQLLAAVGEVAWIADEALMDAVTAVSGSGPAYVFLLAEILEQAATDHGIPPALARQMARRTVAGAGALLAASPEDAAALRRAVTSPGGTTEQALNELMAADAWPKIIRAAVTAAAARAGALAS
jgi:pyrroline-5-carboxylate reductase